MATARPAVSNPAKVAKVLDEADGRVQYGQGLGLLAQEQRREAFQLTVPLLDERQLLVGEVEA